MVWTVPAGAARAMRLVVVLVIAVCAVAAGPVASVHAHSAPLGSGDAPRDAAAAATLADDQQDALEALPPETASGTCARTGVVDGLGRACRTDEGLFRLVMPGGATVETHGSDAPDADVAAAPHLPASQAAVNGASDADVVCVGGVTDKRVELVYAYPSNQPDRSATVAGPLRQALFEASAFVDAESQALDPTAGRRIRTRCDADGQPVVRVVALDPVAPGGASFSGVVSQLVARGYPSATSGSTSPLRLAVFYDAPSSAGAAGTAHMFADDTPGATNRNNRGGRYAVEFAWSISRLPHWDVLLHEMSHNMGAVSDSAPDSSGAGHCTDGLDIMCYDDGGPQGAYSESECSIERYDCGADSYFHPSPAPGSFLATSWNVGSPLNAFLATRVTTGWSDGGVPDTVAPAVPDAPVQSAATTSSVTVTWGASVDDRSPVAYVAVLDSADGAGWTQERTSSPDPSTSATFDELALGTTYRVRVRAIDAAGNESADAATTVATQSGPPLAPTSIAISQPPGAAAVVATWAAGAATTTNPAAASFVAELQTSTGGVWATTASAGTASATVRFDGIAGGSTVRVRVRGESAGGVGGDWRTSAAFLVTAPPPVLAGGSGTLLAPTVHLVQRSTTQLSIAWTTSPGATSWDVELRDRTGSLVQWRTQLTTTTTTFTSLVPGRSWRVLVTAHGEDDAASPDGELATATAADARAPGTVRISGRPRLVRGSVRLAWTAASDDSGVARYEVQRLTGRTWVTVARTSSSVRATTVKLPPRSRATRVSIRVRAVDVASRPGRWTGLLVTR